LFASRADYSIDLTMQLRSAAAFETYGENTVDEIHAAVGPGRVPSRRQKLQRSSWMSAGGFERGRQSSRIE